MVTTTVQVNNPSGLHLKPAAVFVGEASKYDSLVTFTLRGFTANAKSVLSVLAACVKCGDTIELVCSGPDEKAAADGIVKAVTEGLGEFDDPDGELL